MEITTIYEKFHAELKSYVRSKVRSREDAEDIVQNVFVRISSNINALTETVKLKNWIFVITRNVIIDYYRTNAKRNRMEFKGEPDEYFEAEDAHTFTGLDQCMNTMIGLLPEEYRHIIIDAEIKGIKQKDLADKYGMAYPSMRSRIQRGRERLKQLFYNCCHIETDIRGNVIDAREKSGCNSPCKSPEKLV